MTKCDFCRNYDSTNNTCIYHDSDDCHEAALMFLEFLKSYNNSERTVNINKNINKK